MNIKQRNKNRQNAKVLHYNFRKIELSKHICENCGEPGGHWVSIRGSSLQAIMTGVDDQQGFWTCSKYYGPDGRRLPEHTEQNFIF
jgi:hypothetical protein